MIRLQQIDLPDFGVEAVYPELSTAEYESRLDAAVGRMTRRGLDILLVYGDREHFANLAFLTGYDPRFEEAVLLLDAGGKRLLLLGNEGIGYVAEDAPRMDVHLFGDLSLLAQPRTDSPSLRQIFTDFGIGGGTRVGTVGWKYYDDRGGVEGGPLAIEIPAYLVDLLRDLTGSREAVRNATDLFMAAADGLRIENTAAQIAQFEYAAIRVSEAVRAVITHLADGVSERELARHLYDAGLPRTCHPMISVGQKVRRGLSSPSDNVAALGDPFTVAFGLRGALTCRAGAVAAGPEDMAEGANDFFSRFAVNYFEVVGRWYESVRVGAVGGDVFAAVEAARDDALYDFAVNPGHSLHLDEWVHSAFFDGSDIPLRSGMALQMDIIPVSKGPFWYVNAEDGIALADDALRAELAEKHPTAWRRIVARQRFMRQRLGIALDESVLPLSDTPAVLSPYLLSPDQVFVQE